MIKKFKSELGYKPSKTTSFSFPPNNDKYLLLSNIFKYNTIPHTLITIDDIIIVKNGSPKLISKTIKSYFESSNKIGFLHKKDDDYNLIWLDLNNNIYIYGETTEILETFLTKITRNSTIINISIDFSSETYFLIFLIFKILDYSDFDIFDLLKTSFPELEDILLNSLMNYQLNL